MSYGNEIAYNNLDPATSCGWGHGWMPHDLASLTIEEDRVLYKIGPNQTEAFHPIGGGNYEAAYYVRDLLYHHSDSSGEGYTLLDPHGRRREFDAGGRLISFANAFGHTGLVSYDGGGKLSSVEVMESGGSSSSSSGPGDSWRYEYHWSGSLIDYVILYVKDRAVTKRVPGYDGDQLQTVRTYVNSTESTGTPDWGNEDECVDAAFFVSDSGKLRYVIGRHAYSQIQRACPGWPASGSPAFADYADVEFAAYDGANRVTQVKTNGGRYTYGLSYSVNEAPPSSLNDWTAKTEITQPDGSLHTLYFNQIGQVILRQVDEEPPSSSSSSSSSPGKKWYPLYQRFEEVTGRITLSAGMSAIAAVNEVSPSLVTLHATAGMLTLYGYTSGNLTTVHLKEGESSGSSGSHDPILRLTKVFDDAVTEGGHGPVYFLTSVTVYRDDDGLEPCTTTFANTFYDDTFQIEQRPTTLPAVGPEENGSGTAAVVDEFFDEWGYLTKRVDERGTATEFRYDRPRGAMIERTDDAGLYRQNLITTLTPDDLGRTVLTQGPEHPIVLNGDSEVIRTAHWTYYKDREDEVWQFSGYTLAHAGQAVGPVTISRDDEAPPSGKTGWRQASRVDVKFTGTGLPAPDHDFAREDWVRWSLQLFDKGGEFKESRLYWDIPAEEDHDGYGVKSLNYGETLYDYDTAGRQNKVTSPGGTIDRTEFNCMGWPLENWTGTVDGGYGDNMVLTSSHEFDDDGQATRTTLIADPSNAALDRITDYVYDWRHRRVETLTSVEACKGSADVRELKTSLTYDNRDLVTKAENFAKFLPASSSSSSAPPEFIRTAKQTAAYDARGRRYRSRQYAVNPATGDAGAYLEDNTFYDQGGNVVRSAPAGQTGYTVNHYDALSRRTKTFLACDAPASSSSSSSGPFDPADVSNSLVAEQTEFDYDDAGNTLSTIRRERFDTTTEEGPLGDPTEEPKARVNYTAMYADSIGRTVATAEYGTNAGGSNPWERDNDSIPEPSDDVLVSQTHFDPAGNATEHTDPTGRVDRTEFDHADRKTKTIENYEPPSSSSSSSSGPPPADVNKTTHFTYTDDSLPLTQTSDNDSTGPQTTTREYNVTQAGGSKLNSHRLVSRIILPPRSNSSSSSSSGPDDDSILLSYNTQAQVIERTDQAGTTHAYSFDRLGRGLTDAVTAFGSGVDNFIGVLETVWDARGLRERAVSWDAAGTTVRNEVKWEYNNFGQPVHDYQEHDGAVDGSTLHVDFEYADPSDPDTLNTIRQTHLNYPNTNSTRKIRYEYGEGLDHALNRPQAIVDQTGGNTPAIYRYLGRSTVVGITCNHASNVVFTLGPAADNYPGLDRFGRLAETIWQDAFDDKLVHTQYGRTRFGAVAWRYDAAAHALNTTVGDQQDHFYQYDGLYRVTVHQRGTLNEYHTGIDPAEQTEVFNLDQMGNWLAYESDQLTPAQQRDFNPLNEITELTNPSGVIQPAYDLAGNMTTLPAPANWTTAFTLTWDAWNRLTRVQEDTALKGAYRYDALHRRITTTLDDTDFRHFYYNGSQVIEERLGNTFDRDYLWGVRGPRDLIRRRTGLSTPVFLYCLNDSPSPAAVINTSGAVLERYSYDTYGRPRFLEPDFTERDPNESAVGWNFLWNSLFQDTETGLYHLGDHILHSINQVGYKLVDLVQEAAGRMYHYGLGIVTAVRKTSPPEPHNNLDRYEGLWAASTRQDCCCAERIVLRREGSPYGLSSLADRWLGEGLLYTQLGEKTRTLRSRRYVNFVELVGTGSGGKGCNIFQDYLAIIRTWTHLDGRTETAHKEDAVASEKFQGFINDSRGRSAGNVFNPLGNENHWSLFDAPGGDLQNSLLTLYRTCIESEVGCMRCKYKKCCVDWLGHKPYDEKYSTFMEWANWCEMF